MHRCVVPLLVLVVVAVALPAGAQEKGQVGVTMAYPASIGLVFHPTETVAVRPDITFSRSSSESTGVTGAGNTSTSTGVSVGLSALFYVRTWDQLKAYFSPRFGYSRSTGSSTSNTPPVTGSSQGTGNTYSVSGSLGAQYKLNSRFGVFAETGILFARATSSTSGTSTVSGGAITSSSSSHGNSWTTRAGIGGILYF